MKRVEAIIRPHRLSEALASLAKLRITGVTVIDIMGFGLQPGHHSEVYETTTIRSGEDLEVGLVRKKMIVMYVEDANVPKVVETIAYVARTGYPGDGRIAVSELKEIIRVRVDAETVVA
jgi:nitrogen regulatory protein PII